MYTGGDGDAADGGVTHRHARLPRGVGNAAAIALNLTPSTTSGLLRSGSPIEAASSARRLASAGGGRRHSGWLPAARRRAARAPP